MINHQLFGVLAGVLSFSAYTLYIYKTLKGKTKPNKATWWILTLIGVIISSSYYAGGARATMWIALSYVLGPLIIAITSIKYGEGEWESLDKWCLFVAIISAFVWYFSKSPQIALVMNIVMDFIALVPTIKKSYLRPEGEDRPAWTLESISGLINLFAIEIWSFSLYFYPLYLIFINGIITTLLYRPFLKRLNKIYG